MSSTEISSVLVERMEQEEFRTGLGVYGPEALKQRDMVQLGKRLCGLIHSSAEKFNLPTDLLGPDPFTRSLSVAEILEKHTEFSPTVELTDEWRTYIQQHSFNSTLYRSRLHIEALQADEYLGKFIDYSVKETSKYYDCLVKLPKELYDEFLAITVDCAEISSINDQLMKLTEKVSLACGHETANAFEGTSYRVMLLTKAIETHQSLEKFIHSSFVKALPPSVVFLKSRGCFSSMIPKEDLETYKGLGLSLDNLHVRIIDIPGKKHDFLNICWHAESHALKDALKNVRKTDHMAIISSSILAMAAQAGGSFLSNMFADPPSNRTGKWALDFVEAAMLVGFGLTIGGMGISRVKPEISGVMIKSGAIATAGAFIASLAIPLLPVVGFTVGPFTFCFVAAAIALA